jgi:hypothetical protein
VLVKSPWPAAASVAIRTARNRHSGAWFACGRFARVLLLGAAAISASPSRAFVLEDTYGMSPEQRIWYFGGVYDAARIDPRTAACADKLGFERFMQSLSRFITDLPSDASSVPRRHFDQMPAAAVAQLVLEAECHR